MKLKYRHVSCNNVFTLDQEVNQLAMFGFVCDGPIVVTVVSSRDFMYTQRVKKEVKEEIQKKNGTLL